MSYSITLLHTNLVAELRQMIESARRRAALAVNAELTLLYWRVGERIHHEILGGQRAGYGDDVVAALARHLSGEYGRGWSARQLRLCIRFAQAYPDMQIVHTLCAKLSWSHLRLLAALEDSIQRDFYTELCQLENMSEQARRQPLDRLVCEI